MIPLAIRLRRWTAEGTIIVLAAIFIGAVWLLADGAASRMERADTSAAAKATSRMAGLIAERFAETTHQIDALQHLGALLTDALTGHRDIEASHLLTELRRATGQPGSMVIGATGMDAAGNLLWTTYSVSAQSVNFRDRDYYPAIVGGGHDRFIGRPVAGKLTSYPVIPFAAAVRDEQGALVAITAVSLNAYNLKPLAADLDLGPQDLISLWRDDGLVLARSKDIKASDPTRADRLFRLAFPNGAFDEIGTGGVTHVLRFLSVRRVPNTGFYVAAGRNFADAMASSMLSVRQVWQWARVISGVLAVLAMVLIALVSRNRRLQDIEQRSRDLAQSEALLRTIAAEAPDMISLQDEQRCHIFINRAVTQKTGLSPDMVAGKPIGSTIPDEDMPAVTRAYDELDLYGGARRLMYRSRTTGGGIIWLEAMISTFTVKSPAGVDVRRYVTIARDVTNRRFADSALRDARAQIATLMMNASGLIYKMTFRPDGGSETVVLSGNSFLGYDAEAIGGSGFAQARLPPEELPKRQAALRKCLRDGQAVYEGLLPAASGEKRWVRETMNLGEPDGDHQVIVGFACDITDEREAKLRLQQSERLASLGSVASNIAHELNQPLAAISMAAENGIEILNHPAFDAAPAIAKFRRIIEQIERIGQVISHIRKAGPSAAREPIGFHLAEAVEGVMLLVEQRLRREHVAVTCTFPSDLPPIAAPRVLIEQVLMNLIVNACDAYAENAGIADTGTPRAIAISARRDKAMVHIRVADTAGGIPADVIGHVFDPFFTTKAAGKGTGLGLSISYATVAETGGHVAVHNEGGGAVFEIHIPAVNPEAASDTASGR